jgi:hypothetical protein
MVVSCDLTGKYSYSLDTLFHAFFLTINCSFSKVIAPGMRIGTITTSPFFQKYFTALVDSSTQQPAGFGQFFLTEMLGERGWKLDGYARWGSALCKEYQRKRDYFFGVFNRTIQPTGFASVSLPQAGMFVWIMVHVEVHPRFSAKEDTENKAGPRTNTFELMEELFTRLVDAGLAIIPAERFLVSRGPNPVASEDGHLLDVSFKIHPECAPFIFVSEGQLPSRDICGSGRGNGQGAFHPRGNFVSILH